MRRYENWELRFHGALTEVQDRPFAWGQWDCILAACWFIEQITGVDPAKDFRGRYKTEKGAIRTITEAGHCLLQDMVRELAKRNGMESIDPKLARRGDLVRFRADMSYGIVHLNGKDAVGPGETGLRRLPALSAAEAWRVGN